MWKVSFSIVMLIVLALCSANSEEVDFTQPLTLGQCIGIAIERSPNMKTANLDLISSGLSVKDAKAKYYPSINANAQYQFSNRVDFGFNEDNYDAQISASYQIWDHGKRKTSLNQAKASAKATQTEYDRTIQSLIFDVTNAYYNFLQSEKIIAVDEKLLEISKRNVEKAEEFLKNGKTTPADVASAKVQQSNDELALINAQNNQKLAQARLVNLMGLDKSISIKIQDDPDYELYLQSNLVKKEFSLDDSIIKAIQNRPELNSLRARLNIAELSLRQAQLDRFPVLTAEYNYNLLFGTGMPNRDEPIVDNSWNASARLSFPIFDGGISKRRQQNAEISVEQSKENIRSREQAIALEVQQEFFSFERTVKSLDIAKEQVDNATLSLDVTQGRYDQGMTIFLDVLSAQARYAQALINQVNAFYNYKIAEKSLKKVIGDLGIEE
ncbi:TPA: TolC family protein [bacterium]|nr:TolC family protein [bacterium]